MNFVFFVLLNAVMLIRPEELFPGAGLRLYLILISLCTMSSLPRLLEKFSSESLRNRPVTVCVLLYFASTIVSDCMHGRVTEALFEEGPEFAKVVLYYFLIISVVDTPGRFRTFVASLIVIIALLTAIALAKQFEIMEFPTIKPCKELYTDPNTGEEIIYTRMVSSGIFNDPNDLCQALSLGILSCIYCATTIPKGFTGCLPWLLPIPLFGYALLETHSRGGLLGVLAGLACYTFSRYGGPKSIPYVVAGSVAVLASMGGRQGDFSAGGTSHGRLMFWADGLKELFAQPLYIPTGLGSGWFTDEMGIVAHNSFVQAYVEQGLVGGGAFLAAFYLSARIAYGLGQSIDAPSWAIQARHYVFAIVIAYAVGCFSLTRNIVVPTYLTLGIASILLEAAAPTLPERFCVNRKWFGWAILFGVCGLLFIKYTTQTLGLIGV